MHVDLPSSIGFFVIVIAFDGTGYDPFHETEPCCSNLVHTFKAIKTSNRFASAFIMNHLDELQCEGLKENGKAFVELTFDAKVI